MNPVYPLGMLISGGQTGVDQAALGFALRNGIPCGGWCPAGRRSEAGPIPAGFPLRECASPRYPPRTRANVRDADATLILTAGPPVGGTELTARLAARLGRPFLILDLGELSLRKASLRLREWLWRRAIPRILNVAGPRASECPGLSRQVETVLRSSIGPPPPGSEPLPWPPPIQAKPAQPLLFGED